LNQVYMGQFRPDADAGPRWPGNLKLYQLKNDDNNQPILIDRFGLGVEDTVNGFILPTTTSFWSTATTSFWSYDSANMGGASDSPDGRIVEKGGVAQRLRQTYASSQVGRKIYTCNGSCGSLGTAFSSVGFNTTNTTGLTVSSLGVADEAERTSLINWIRGEDNIDDENKNSVSTDVRALIHGDLLHSRPVVVNYNRDASERDIVVYYGSNDGLFRAIKGGTDDSDGAEKWGIVFPEFFGKLKRLRDNSPDISNVSPKPYFVDGSVSVYQQDINNDGKLVCWDAARRQFSLCYRRE
jgi:type IV pilus assembly protein PilY1